MAWHHALVEDSADEDAGSFGAIDDHVLLMLHATITGPNLVACSAHLRRLSDAGEAGEEVVKVGRSLFLTLGVHCVVGNLYKAEPGQVGEPVVRQPTVPSPMPVFGFARGFRRERPPRRRRSPHRPGRRHGWRLILPGPPAHLPPRPSGQHGALRWRWRIGRFGFWRRRSRPSLEWEADKGLHSRGREMQILNLISMSRYLMS